MLIEQCIHVAIYSLIYCFNYVFPRYYQAYSVITNTFNSDLPGVVDEESNETIYSASQKILHQDALLSSVTRKAKATNSSPSDGRVMLIDGTSVIYRAYYKILGTRDYASIIQCVASCI